MYMLTQQLNPFPITKFCLQSNLVHNNIFKCLLLDIRYLDYLPVIADLILWLAALSCLDLGFRKSLDLGFKSS